MTPAQAREHQIKHGFGDPFPEQRQEPEAKPKKLRGGAKLPNKTEAEFGLILESQKGRGEIIRYVYQGITLHWGDGMRYTPDWFVILPARIHRCVEVKGARIWDRDIVRFKGCKAEWPEFEFEMHQKAEGRWQRIL
jgi:hypothetical protein